MKHTLLMLTILLLFTLPCFALHTEIQDYKNIKFEYENIDSLQNTPLVICIPGFTQHNRSPEFRLLKEYFQANGYSYLIMNPPQHGEIYHRKRMFTWGEREVDDLVTVAVEGIDIFNKHSEVHLLGFSVGAKIVLKFAARPEIQHHLTSVVAVAAPYQIGAINGRFLSNGHKGVEGFFSGNSARKRSSFLRLSYMVFPGLFRSLLLNKESPAEEISKLDMPVLLIHSSGDWLTNVRHSKMLFDRGTPQQPLAIVAIKTVTHAEDMLSRDSEAIRDTFFEILTTWLKFVKDAPIVRRKSQYNQEFTRTFSHSVDRKNIFPVEKLTELSRPTMHNRRANIWTTQSEQNPAFITLQSVMNRDGNSREFVTIGGKTQQKIIGQLQGGFAWHADELQELAQPEAYFSLYQPFGSFLWARKLTYVQGLKDNSERQILSADLAFLLLDFQLNYGQIRTSSKKDLQLYCNYPLINSPTGNYFAGVTYCQFLDTRVDGKDLSAYLFYGPKIVNTRVQAFAEYHFLKPNNSSIESRLRFGIAFNFRER
ncbi:MAG: hypothetical protein H6696_10070 [Deferribacteres bacterium]|nr:hypothetical protein [candidate division KSB1 bacterium]MCB9502274.1 hypothetical protein [Deferribacteres bacterium]